MTEQTNCKQLNYQGLIEQNVDCVVVAFSRLISFAVRHTVQLKILNLYITWIKRKNGMECCFVAKRNRVSIEMFARIKWCLVRFFVFVSYPFELYVSTTKCWNTRKQTHSRLKIRVVANCMPMRMRCVAFDILSTSGPTNSKIKNWKTIRIANCIRLLALDLCKICICEHRIANNKIQ